MKKRSISALIVLIMLCSFTLTSCSNETDTPDTEAPIYTLYTIVDGSTTPDAIREVELALNRIVFNELGCMVKLFMVTEEEYEDLITQKFDELEEYEANKKASSSGSSSSDSSADGGEDVMTGEKWLEIMEAGGELELSRPRLDIFLVNGFENYTTLVSEEKLSALDEKLSADAKTIKDYIYPTFLSAAKIANPSGSRKTYGIPMNTGIGEYEYIVLDAELLDKYEFDYTTVKTLADLEPYLKLIKENEPDVVPLSNVYEANNVSYLFTDGFPAYVEDNGTVNNAFETPKILNYYTMISRYRSLGYITDETEKRFAVKFISGNFETLEELEKTEKREYKNIIYSYPVATNENSLQNLFCVSKYCVSNDLTAVSKLLQFILTNKRAANILTYGVETIHYNLDNENSQVVRLNQDYITEQKYTGNAFLTYTLEGENPNKWDLLKQQNMDSDKSNSATVGFTYYPNSFENPDNKNTLKEPNYVETILDMLPEYYDSLLSGKAGETALSVLEAYAREKLLEDYEKSLKTLYENDLKFEYEQPIKQKYAAGSADYNRIAASSRNRAIKNYIEKNYNSDYTEWETALQAEIEENNPEASISEIADMLSRQFSDEYVAQKATAENLFTEEDIAESAKKILTDSIVNNIETEIGRIVSGEEFKNEYNNRINSQEFQNTLQNKLNNADYYEYQKKYTEYILNEITAFCGDALIEFGKELEKEYNEYLGSVQSFLEEDGQEYQSRKLNKKVLSNVIDDLVDTQVENAIKADLRAEIEKELTDSGEEVTNDILDAYVKDRYTAYKQANALDYLTPSKVIAEYDIQIQTYIEKGIGITAVNDTDDGSGTGDGDGDTSGETSGEGSDTSSDTSDTSDETSTGEETENNTDTDPDDINPDDEPEEEVNFFNLIFEKRIQAQYYVFAPLPTE